MTGVNVLAPLFPPVSNEDLDEDPFDELDEDAVCFDELDETACFDELDMWCFFNELDEDFCSPEFCVVEMTGSVGTPAFSADEPTICPIGGGFSVDELDADRMVSPCV